jgi:hypothetical protein
MPAKRLPNKLAEITGAATKNPQRYAGRANPPTKPLGAPLATFTAEQAAIWATFANDFPWLARSDRQLVRLAVDLELRIDAGTAPVSTYAQMRLVLQSMGGTPCDRSRVSAPDDESDDPADEFLQ